MMPAERLPLLGCLRTDQHPGHAWSPLNDDDDAWCDGLNADGTAPYDPARRGYAKPPALTQQPRPLEALAAIASDVKGHISIHASYGPEAIRHPAPDWTCQLIYTVTDEIRGSNPVTWFGTGATLDAAVEQILDQLLAALAERTQKDTP